MKIAIVADTYDNVNTGGTLSIRRLVGWLRDSGHEVRIVATGKPYDGKYSVPGFYLPILKPAMIKTNFIFGVPDPSVLSAAFSGVDIVHVAFPFQLGRGAVRFAKERGIPVVVSCHVQPENILFNIKLEKLRIIRDMLYKKFIKQFYNVVEHVHCPSRYAAEELTRFGCTARMHVISNGIPPEIIRRKISAKRTEDPFVILSVGRHSREKRQETLIKAVAMSKHRKRIQLVIAGTGPITEELRRKSAELPITPIIDFLPDDELARWRKEADLYVHSSEIELESMSCLEAIGTGIVPVIAEAPSSAASQFALDDRSLFPVKDAEALVRKIDYWLDHDFERRAAEELYAESAKQFSYGKTVVQTIDLYRAGIGEHREQLVG